MGLLVSSFKVLMCVLIVLSLTIVNVTAEVSDAGLPSWIENFVLKGDLRLRDEYIVNDPGVENNRQRLRFRLGAKTKINEKIKLGFGFASGSSDSPTSTNQTLEQEFQSKSLWLDYAYVKYKAFDWLKLKGGKFKSPFFHTDMLWDSDIRFDGFAVLLKNEFSSENVIYLTGGFFPIDNRSTTSDINLYAAQLGTNSEFYEGFINLNTGLAIYGFSQLKGVTAAKPSLLESKLTNTTIGGALANDFLTINANAKLYFKDIIGNRGVGILGEFAHNYEAPAKNQAWRAGVWFGQSKVKHPRQWKLLAQYTHLEADAFFDSFPDSDFNFGGTDGKGWEIIFNYGLAEHVVFGLDYYNTEKISAPRADQQILQADLMFKF